MRDAVGIDESYRRLRRISERHQREAMACVATAGLMEHAKQLGLTIGRTIVAENEGEMALLADLAVYTAKPGRSRAIDRYAKSVSLEPESEEGQVLETMRQARFSFWRIEGYHDADGLIVTDRFREAEVWLLDYGLARSCKPGMVLGGRIYSPADFAMSCGALVPVSRELIEDLWFEMPFLAGPADLERMANDPRFAAAVYRAAINTGIVEHVEYRRPAAFA